MNCETLEQSLALYPDGMLASAEKAAADLHLAACPLCRQKLDDIRSIATGLRQFSPIRVPADLAVGIRTTVRTEIYRRRHSRFAFVSEGFREYLQMRVMPYAVGATAALLLGFTLLWALLAGTAGTSGDIASADDLTAPVFLPPTSAPVPGDEITPTALASERLAVSGESPSVNPQGALIALTKSLARGSMKDHEVVVVADVFSDGLANVEEVVEPLDDAKTVFEIEKALRQDKSDAPFVPAFLDKRADSVRVVLKIQRVDIKTGPRKR